jgi:23S rRNA (adenine2030-N6)-methyltransferase
MNYRHAFHAGNFADVLKHAALVAVIQHLKKKEKPFAIIDTHAGRGIYETTGTEAQKTGEAATGIGRLLPRSSLPGVLGDYVSIVRTFGDGRYPGSPLIAARMLRPKDRLVAVESGAAEYDALANELFGFPNARAIMGDGYRELLRFLPPPERRAAVLIDPPYEREDEFARVAEVLTAAYRRFATGIYLLWYPAKLLPLVSATAAELLNAGTQSLVRVELDIGAISAPPRPDRGPPMAVTGILVINPPFGFTREMQAILPFLAEALAQGRGATCRVEILAEC